MCIFICFLKKYIIYFIKDTSDISAGPTQIVFNEKILRRPFCDLTVHELINLIFMLEIFFVKSGMTFFCFCFFYSLQNDAKRSIEYLVSQLANADKNTFQFVLCGLRKITTSFPHLLNQYLPEINKHCQNKPNVSDLLQKLCEDLKRRSATFPETEDLRKKYVSFEGEELRKKFVTFSEGDIHLSGST